LPERVRRQLQNWTVRQRELLSSAREEAVMAGIARLEGYFGRTLEQAFDQLIREHRWRDALGSLKHQGAWLGAGGADVNVHGLSDLEQQRILTSVLSARTAKYRQAENDYYRLDGELANFVDTESRSLEDELRGSAVSGASDALEQAYQAECDARGIDPAQIPEAWLQPGGILIGSTLRLRGAKERLAVLEARILRERAQALFPADDRTASRLCRDRRYVEAAEYWEQHLEDPGSLAVHLQMQVRLRETRHLEALLEQAANGVRRRRGLEFRPIIEGIEFDGIILTAEDVLERGFQLLPNDKNFEAERVHLVRPDPLPKGEHLLTANFVLELAALKDSAEDQYRSALFLFYENQLQKAWNTLPRVDPAHKFDDLLEAHTPSSLSNGSASGLVVPIGPFHDHQLLPNRRLHLVPRRPAPR